MIVDRSEDLYEVPFECVNSLLTRKLFLLRLKTFKSDLDIIIHTHQLRQFKFLMLLSFLFFLLCVSNVSFPIPFHLVRSFQCCFSSITTYSNEYYSSEGGCI